MITEDQLEQFCLDWFRASGYEYAYGPDIAHDGDIVQIGFRDDGPGYPEDVLRLERHGVGFDLIQNIVRDSLHGDLFLQNDPGAEAVVRFKAQV